MVKLEVELDEYIPLRDLVFKTLREAIITGQLMPGERLMEIKIANELGVSRTPVREAIRKLELEGLVIINARRGAIVAPINEKDLMEILEIRRALESLASSLACSKSTPKEVQELMNINDEIKQAIDDNDIALITQKDVEFHDTISQMSKNDHLIKMLHQIKEHIYRYRLEFIKEMKNRESIVEDHKKIIEAITVGNSKNAGKELEKHIDGQEKYILGKLAEMK